MKDVKGVKDWTPGMRHPETDKTIFRNVWEQDRVRQGLKSRCVSCGFVVSDDFGKVRELVYSCNDRTCCKPISSLERQIKAHQVCDLCYDMFHALYLNYGGAHNPGLKNRDYFKDIDIQERKDRDDRNRRDRMGLS